MKYGDLISRQAVIDALTKTSGIRGDVLKALYDLPSVENKCFDGMTNREIISEFVERDDSFAIMVDEVNGTVNIELSLDFWNAPYEKREE